MEQIAQILFLIQIVLVAFDALVVVALVLVLRKARAARPDIWGAPPASASAAASRRAAQVREAWASIEAQAARGPEGARLAVIDADRLVDRLLKDAGYEGEGALERMRQLPADRLASVSDLLAAHRFRNRLVHEASFVPADRELAAALAQFQSFLAEVGYLE